MQIQIEAWQQIPLICVSQDFLWRNLQSGRAGKHQIQPTFQQIANVFMGLQRVYILKRPGLRYISESSTEWVNRDICAIWLILENKQTPAD